MAGLSLLQGVQALLERTYGMRTRLDASRFVIGDRGYRRLLAEVEVASGAPESGARTLVRETEDGLRAAIYFPDRMIARLEAHPPQRGLQDQPAEPAEEQERDQAEQPPAPAPRGRRRPSATS